MLHSLYFMLVIIAWLETKGKLKKNRQKQEEIYPAVEYEKFKKLRQNKEVHTLFIKRFVRLVVGDRLWKQRMRDPAVTDINDLCTVSNEAFTLLILENNWDRWVDISRRAKNRFRHANKTSGEKPVESDITPLYTDILQKGVYGVERGWKTKGILRYNELCKQIGEDRVTNRDISKALVRTLKSELSPPTKKRKLYVNQPKAYCEIDLGMTSSDDDSTEHDDSDGEEHTFD